MADRLREYHDERISALKDLELRAKNVFGVIESFQDALILSMPKRHGVSLAMMIARSGADGQLKQTSHWLVPTEAVKCQSLLNSDGEFSDCESACKAAAQLSWEAASELKMACLEIGAKWPEPNEKGGHELVDLLTRHYEQITDESQPDWVGDVICRFLDFDKEQLKLLSSKVTLEIEQSIRQAIIDFHDASPESTQNAAVDSVVEHLSDTRQTIFGVIGTEPMQGPQIAKKAGYSYDCTRRHLSALLHDKLIIHVKRQGYRLP